MNNGREIGILVFHNGGMVIVCMMEYKCLRKGSIRNGGGDVGGIIGVEKVGMEFVIQTFDSLYYLKVTEAMIMN